MHKRNRGRPRNVLVRCTRIAPTLQRQRYAFFCHCGDRHGGLVAFMARSEVVLEGVHIGWKLSDLSERDGEIK